MTREQAKELLPAIQHFANGGDLWYYAKALNKWTKQVGLYNLDIPCNIIQDKHFEARKAFALGEEIQYFNRAVEEWCLVPSGHEWLNRYEFRPKPKEVYEWQWYFIEADGYYQLSMTRNTKEEAKEYGYIDKYEPSKRIRK